MKSIYLLIKEFIIIIYRSKTILPNVHVSELKGKIIPYIALSESVLKEPVLSVLSGRAQVRVDKEKKRERIREIKRHFVLIKASGRGNAFLVL